MHYKSSCTSTTPNPITRFPLSALASAMRASLLGVGLASGASQAATGVDFTIQDMNI